MASVFRDMPRSMTTRCPWRFTRVGDGRTGKPGGGFSAAWIHGVWGTRGAHRDDGGRGRPPPRLAHARGVPRPASARSTSSRARTRLSWRSTSAAARRLGGLFIAGICFIMPAVLIVTGLRVGIRRFGRLPQADGPALRRQAGHHRHRVQALLVGSVIAAIKSKLLGSGLTGRGGR